MGSFLLVKAPDPSVKDRLKVCKSMVPRNPSSFQRFRALGLSGFGALGLLGFRLKSFGVSDPASLAAKGLIPESLQPRSRTRNYPDPREDLESRSPNLGPILLGVLSRNPH